VDAALRQLNDQLDLATQRLLDAARVLPEPDLRAPSLLPGWTRAHVLAHLARGADAMRTLLIGARVGELRPAYASAQAREEVIATSAAQAPRELMTDIADSAMALRTVARQLPDEAWSFQVQILGSKPFPASQLLTRRLVEVELHHCDLGIGYDAAKWPAAFAEAQLPEPMRSQRQDRLNYPPQHYQPPPPRSAATPGPAQQRAMILKSLSSGS
jgi:maleylpyruvate isomerase